MKNWKVKKFGSGNDHLLIIKKPQGINRVIYFLQSYDSIVACAEHYTRPTQTIDSRHYSDGDFISLTLDGRTWDYSKTTAKHRNAFMDRFTPWAVNNTNSTTKRISTGDIILENLN